MGDKEWVGAQEWPAGSNPAVRYAVLVYRGKIRESVVVAIHTQTMYLENMYELFVSMIKKYGRNDELSHRSGFVLYEWLIYCVGTKSARKLYDNRAFYRISRGLQHLSRKKYLPRNHLHSHLDFSNIGILTPV